MADKSSNDKTQADEVINARQRRALLKKLGRFAAVSAPTVTLLLAAKAKPGAAATSCGPVRSSRAFKTRLGPVDSNAVLAAVKTLPIRRRA